MIGLVLAAGRGLRMGGPKALLPWGSPPTPLALAHAAALEAAGVERVVVVVRADVAAILGPQNASAGVSLAVSSEPEDAGAAGSLRCGLSSLGWPSEGRAVITLTDALPVEAAVLDALTRAAGDGAAKPVFQGVGGHPVVVPCAWLGVYRDGAPTLRDVLRTHGERVVRVTVSDPRVTADLDTPAELARWSAQAGAKIP